MNKPLKHLYVVARNHMDPTWLRAFVDHIDDKELGGIVRPYSELEEQQILEYMNFAELYGVKYHIEQAAVVKLFLAKNPDQKERFTALVQKGLIELAGGGECVIDRNMTCGESWVRNHLYSIDYYKKTFGRAPRYAITPDIFGLPAQLPQFFRSIGYDADIVFDRVMLQNKPFWRGLDGTKIVLDNQYLGMEYPRTADCVKLLPCNACHGEGCPVCNGTGIDPSYDTTRPDKILERMSYYGNQSADEFLTKLEEENQEIYYTQITCEETRIGNYLYKQLLEAAPRHGFAIHFVTYEENHERWCAGRVDALRRGDTPEELVDERVEGNPMFTACYSSLGEIKKANAELERALYAAETLATLALAKGGWNPDTAPRRDYPAEKLASLWNKMAYIQFHDNLPGTIVDGAYVELQRVIRQVRSGAAQIYRDAAREYVKACRIDVPAGYEAVVVFNTDNKVNHFPQLVLQGPADMKGVVVTDMGGNRLPAFDLTVTPERVGIGATLAVRADIPAFGHRVLFWKALTEADEKTDVSPRTAIENEFYRITVAGNEIAGVWDKDSGKQLLGEHALCLTIGTDDSCSAYGHAAETDYHKLPFDELSFETTAVYQRIIAKGHETNPEKRVNRLEYTVTLTLRAGEKLVRIGTDIDWDGSANRIYLSLPAAFATDKKIYGEVPFGMLARDEAGEDLRPTLSWAGVHGDDVNVAVIKSGLPATRLQNDNLEVIVFRSAAIGESRYMARVDCGRHRSELAFCSWTGSIHDENVAAAAASFLLPVHTEPYFADWVPQGAEALPETGSTDTFAWIKDLPANVCVSALKPAQDGNGYIVRVWESMGKPATLNLPDGLWLQHCNSLEETDGIVSERVYNFRPFEIATFRFQ